MGELKITREPDLAELDMPGGISGGVEGGVEGLLPHGYGVCDVGGPPMLQFVGATPLRCTKHPGHGGSHTQQVMAVASWSDGEIGFTVS